MFSVFEWNIKTIKFLDKGRGLQENEARKDFNMMRDYEQAILVKDFPEGAVIVERANGEKWKLDAKKDWCRWAWLYEGKYVRLKFGYVSSILVNDEGESCEFWTEEQIF